MDAKNDDSAGSDSLDKSLQKKCVVDDVGQGEGVAAGAAVQGGSESGEKKTDLEAEGRSVNSMKKQKTEKSVGDGVGGGGQGGGGGGGGGVTGGIEISSVVCVDSNSMESATKTKSQQPQDAAGPTFDVSRTTASATTSSNVYMNTNTTTPSTNTNSNAFETKVKQISKNLKETTLAESAHKKASLEDSSSTSSSASSASSSSSTPESEQPTSATSTVPSCSFNASTSQAAAVAAAAETSATSMTTELDASQLAAGELTDEHDHRSKKVRFHPDVKENDGGNRVIPKKKKKLKSGHAGGSGSGSGVGEDATTSSQRAVDDEMDLDEEDEIEEEEEFDLAKTIAEAQDYLKAHPLTFVRPYDKSSGRLQNGLLEEEDLPQLSESSEEEDVYEQVPPENGVERILGKQIKCGKVEFLLRYADRPGLSWESEEFICKHCPTLLSKYEENRERRQERLMRHVARRQNIRQRYTDF